MTAAPLPIDALRAQIDAALGAGRLVLSSPTGSGKSTQVPRWCMARGPVLVVEPRRVACRGLAARVAELEGVTLGAEVGYHVRDDRRAGSRTRLLFATPGIVLQMLSGGGLEAFSTVILDEFHERSLDVDLLLALLLRRYSGSLLVMSATLDGDRIAAHIGGVYHHGGARVFPVDRRHIPSEGHLPTTRGLESRILQAVDASRDLPGDLLVFLPGKAEIARAADALRTRRDLEVLPLHGGLDLAQQSRVFTPGDKRRAILATNVAETSITIPGIGVVIDSGLVRRTEYHHGRGFLTVVPIAQDSAEQRAGRAGRTAPGVCFRLWSLEARLADRTPPEIHRESLTPLVLAAAACGAPDPATLPFLDPPKPYALEAAVEELRDLGALAVDGQITQRGRRIFGLPLDAALGSLLVVAEATGCVEDAIDLVSVLAVGRPLFTGGAPDPSDETDPRECGCDVVATLRAIRGWKPKGGQSMASRQVSGFVLEEARAIRRRLREAWNLPERTAPETPIDRRRLALTTLRADPRCAHVARRRNRDLAWSSGGTELELGAESAVHLSKAEALLVLGEHALGLGYRDRRILITCAMPVPLEWLVEAGLGRGRVAGVSLEKGQLLARIERVYAQRVLATREEAPTGALARDAIATLFLEGRLFKEARVGAEERLEAWTLYTRLAAQGVLEAGARTSSPLPVVSWPGGGAVPGLEAWVQGRLDALGVESADDLALLSGTDLVPPELPEPIRRRLDQAWPRTVDLGDAFYRVRYDLAVREVTLEKVRGVRKEPPPLTLLPSFHGFRVKLDDRGRTVVLRERR